MAVEQALAQLVDNLQATLKTLKDEETAKELRSALHDSNSLPDLELRKLACCAVDLLGEVDLLLEPAQLVLADHFLGYTNTKCLVAANDLKIADLLSQGPKTLTELATAADANPLRLEQVLRTLRNTGIFAYDHDTACYSNNHISELIRTEHWTQWHNWVELYGNQFYDIARGIPKSVVADQKRWAAQINFDTDDNMFNYFQSQGWVPQLHRTLGGSATAMAPGILADYPWEEVADSVVLDIGGGGGALIASLLRKHKNMRGGVFDLKKTIDHIKPFFQKDGQYADLEDRVPQQFLIPGNFMDWIPGFEVYVMKWCLHDWKDDECVTILETIRRAIKPGEKSRLVVLESVLVDGRMGRLSRYGDVNMAMTANGQERTEADWRRIIERAGWTLKGMYPMRNAWVQALDLRP